MAARENDFCFPIKRAQQLAFPAIPHTRPHRANVANGEHKQHAQTLKRLHCVGKHLDRFGVRQIAAMRDVRHDKMRVDQPGDGICLGFRQTQTRAEFACDPRTCNGMIFIAALGNVMQEERDIKRSAIGDRGQDFRADRMVFGQTPALDARHNADCAQQMLVHRIVVIHVELHHRDNAAEIGDEAAQNARFIHSAQHGLRCLVRGHNVQKQAIGFRIFAQLGINALQRLRDQTRRMGMNGELMLIGELIKPQNIYRVFFKNIVGCDGDAAMFNCELPTGERAFGGAQFTHETIEHGARLGLALFHRRADNRGQIPHIFGDQEIMLHEAFDV